MGDIQRGRSFGRGSIAPVSSIPRAAARRAYRPRAERVPSAAKARIAAARLRDARGHFLPQAEPVTLADLAGDATALAGVIGDTDTLLADLTALGGAEAVY